MRPLLLVASLVAAGGVLAGVASGAAPATAADGALAGRTIVIDPGHQLGNTNPKFAHQMSQTFFNGTSQKGCNTSGTATNAGYPEATMTWQVAQLQHPPHSASSSSKPLSRMASITDVPSTASTSFSVPDRSTTTSLAMDTLPIAMHDPRWVSAPAARR